MLLTVIIKGVVHKNASTEIVFLISLYNSHPSYISDFSDCQF